MVDAVAVNDGGAGDLTYGAPVLGPNYDGISTFAPGGASRIPDGLDTDSTSDWVRNDFDLAGIPGFTGTISAGEAYNTPGATNEAYVPPVTGECGEPATYIHDIQGSGATSPLDGTQVFIEGIVVGDFQNNDQPTAASSTASTYRKRTLRPMGTRRRRRASSCSPPRPMTWPLAISCAWSARSASSAPAVRRPS